MSARESRRSSTRACSNQHSNQDDGGSSSSSSQGSPSEGAETEGLVGRLVAKEGGNKLLQGFVDKYNKPIAGNDESWTVRYNTQLEEIDRSELKAQLDLQMQTAGQVAPPGPAKRGRGRPRKSKNSPDSNLIQGAAKRGRGRPRKSTNSPAKRQAESSPKLGSAKKQRSVTSSSLASQATPKKGKGKGKAGGIDSAPYIGERVAVHFPHYGVFTGDVMEVKAKASMGTLFNVTFEDGDEADYTKHEIEHHIKLYKDLQDSFSTAPVQDEVIESENDDDTTTPRNKGKTKGKSKGGDTTEHVGARVRVYFPPNHDNYYNGTVKKYLASEDNDEHGALHHVTYDDGDSEDLDSMELREAMAMYKYNKRNPLVTKKVSIVIGTQKKQVTLFGENRAGSPVFSTVMGYHDNGRDKNIF